MSLSIRQELQPNGRFRWVVREGGIRIGSAISREDAQRIADSAAMIADQSLRLTAQRKGAQS